MTHHVQADARALPLGDGSIALAMTSPPYADARKRQYGGVHPDAYVEWFRPVGEELYRVLREDGSFVLNIKEKVVDGERHPYVHDLIAMLRGLGWRWVETYIWHKRNGAPGYWPNRFRDLWEHCIHFTKSRHFFMDQAAVMQPVGAWKDSRVRRILNGTGTANDRVRRQSASGSNVGRCMANFASRNSVLPSNVLYLPTEARNVGHPAAYPIALPRFFVNLFTRLGDTVLDPFGGAGTTGLAAMELGRHAVMVERKREYIDIALARQAAHRTSKPKKPRVPRPGQLTFFPEPA